MLFNSLEYLIFFFVILIFSWSSRGVPKIRIFTLLLANYYFYASNNYWLIFIFLFSTQIDYWCAILIEKTISNSKRKIYLTISVILNLLILGFFKYFNFFASSLVELANIIGYTPTWIDLNIVLPIGISFYTFQSLSYSIDVYRGDIKAVKTWVNYSFYNSFFPQLIAGPIIRPKDFLPQVESTPKLSKKDLDIGLTHVFRGLLKKIVLSDLLTEYADLAFNSSSEISSFLIVLGFYAFTFQIYFDFSGYSDIAIGSARLLGYKVPINFNRPYSSTSVTEFWKRWHISLSLWLRDYLYIPLGGNRVKRTYKTYRNLMITMLLGGLWHGASWHFIIWGAFQGIALSIEKLLGIKKNKTRVFFNIKNFLKILLIFHFTVFSWIIFRADSISLILEVFQNLFNNSSVTFLNNKTVIVILLIVFGFSNQLFDEKYNFAQKFLNRSPTFKIFFFAFVFFLCIIFNTEEVKPFIYFQF
jgi:alginate O-acetyltransferase complex protein AlgI